MSKAVFIIGESGAGKTTVMDALMEAYPGKFVFLPFVTTRAPRDTGGEYRYHFISREEFERLRIEDKFAATSEFAGNLYGPLKTEFIEALSRGTVLAVSSPPFLKQFKDFIPDITVIRLKPTGVWTPRSQERSNADAAMGVNEYPVDLEVENQFPEGLQHTLEQIKGFLQEKELV